jgi:hypothetical protein
MVEVTETLTRRFNVKATDEGEAEEVARDMYYEEEVILDSEDLVSAEIRVISEYTEDKFVYGGEA